MTLKEEFEKYIAATFPEVKPGKEQRRCLELAFYGGALISFKLALGASSLSQLDALRAEFEEFSKGLDRVQN